MQTPHVEEREVFEERLLTARATGLCPSCRVAFRAEKLVYLSVHALEFGVQCAGEGRVWKVSIPWCPQCEREPEEFGCVHEQMQKGTRAFQRDPKRCDFCMKPHAPVAKKFIAKGFIEGLMPSGETLVDAGEWGACTECAALIQTGNYAALVEGGIVGTLAMHPELRGFPRGMLRERVKLLYRAVFGMDVNLDGKGRTE